AEKTESGRFKTMGVITSPIDHGKDSVDKALQALKSLRSSGGWSLEQLVDVVAKAVPEMQHVQASKNLDQKM
ncbi:hypothetical protein N9927_04400, partial [Akkermansiaceae bacterium]|nr:hypothetical protein [Akkermansiaceae bacterium]